ncbi:hypothetical protein [Mesorhizobium comanense]|uniref:hypothetical protein n=1 Tax=Mesorhizobium comanense TaxID=2502215 RepID=UPI001484DD03|nr:hypothetical protein [Mesorhizobium comanense]
MGMSRWRTKIKKAVYSKTLRFLDVPPVLWSQGIGHFCDFAGPDWYRCAPTESTRSDAFFRKHYGAAHGIVWVRLSTLARNPQSCDLDTFARIALPTINAPFILLTTDGDASVPSDLSKDTVERLLASPYLVAWYSQNCDGSHPRIKPFPIGLDLHTPRSLTTPAALVAQLEILRERQGNADRRPPRIFCDFSVSKGSRQRRELLDALDACPHVDFLQKRVSQREIWELYSQYPLVLSTVGNGLDCHRTWELLYLGCIVVTRTSPLDPLYEGLPVIIVDDWHEARDPEAPARWIRQVAHLTDRNYIWERLRPQTYLEPLRQELRQAALSPRDVQDLQLR